MQAQTFFLLGGLIGFAQIIDAIVLKNNDYRYSPLTLTTSSLEFVWAIVCVYALFSISFTSWTVALPAIYLSYIIVGFLKTPKELYKIEDFEEMQEIQLPVGFVQAGFAFGIIYCLASCYAWFTIQNPA